MRAPVGLVAVALPVVAGAADAGWGHFGGTSDGTRYSTAKQVDRDNVGELAVAWRYSTGELRRRGPELIANSSTQATPIVVDGLLVFCTPHRGFRPAVYSFAGASSNSRNVARNFAPVAPSTTR